MCRNKLFFHPRRRFCFSKQVNYVFTYELFFSSRLLAMIAGERTKKYFNEKCCFFHMQANLRLIRNITRYAIPFLKARKSSDRREQVTRVGQAIYITSLGRVIELFLRSNARKTMLGWMVHWDCFIAFSLTLFMTLPGLPVQLPRAPTFSPIDSSVQTADQLFNNL